MTLHRRRVLRVLACGLGGAALAREAAAAPVLTWTGAALGAEAQIRLRHADRARAMRALAAVLAEIERLEGEFSLHRADSAISRLNRDGRLARPSLDMRHLLLRAVHFGEITGGAFDVTVQPLWQLLAAHFAAPGADPAGPPAAAADRPACSPGVAATFRVNREECRYDEQSVRGMVPWLGCGAVGAARW